MKKFVILIILTASLLCWNFSTVQAATLGETLSGRILLQVEGKGEAWYVNPVNKQRYFLGNATDALNLMRSLGLGISNANLAKIPLSTSDETGDLALRDRLSGRILLQVESRGEAWYVNPVNKKRYFLGTATDALNLMRSLGLGISNANLAKIPISSSSGTGIVTLVDRVSGRILLQVESHGEGWYVNPVDKKRYFWGEIDDILSSLKEVGLGISNADLRKIPVGIIEDYGVDADGDTLPDALENSIGTSNSSKDSDGDSYLDGVEVRNNYDPLGTGKLPLDENLVNRLKGRILIQVEKHGEAWYVNPLDGKRYLLDKAGALQLIRKFGLGVSNKDLAQIPVAGSGAVVPVAPVVPVTPVSEWQLYADAFYPYTLNYPKDWKVASYNKLIDGVKSVGVSFISPDGKYALYFGMRKMNESIRIIPRSGVVDASTIKFDSVNITGQSVPVYGLKRENDIIELVIADPAEVINGVDFNNLSYSLNGGYEIAANFTWGPSSGLPSLTINLPEYQIAKSILESLRFVGGSAPTTPTTPTPIPTVPSTPVPIPTPTPAPSPSTTIKDCGTDINCAVEASKTCQPAKWREKASLEDEGVIINEDFYYELKQGVNGVCVYYELIENATVTFSQELIDSLLAGGVSSEEIESLRVELNNQIKQDIGLYGSCMFANKVDLTEYLQKVASGQQTYTTTCQENASGEVTCESQSILVTSGKAVCEGTAF